MKELGQLFATIVIVGAWCAMWFVVKMNPDMVFPSQLDIAFWAVLTFMGIGVAKPVVSNVLGKVYGKPQDGKGTPNVG